MTTSNRVSGSIPWIRGLIFTVLVPGTVAIYVPWRMAARITLQTGWSNIGWAPVVLGMAGYLWCFADFLMSGGTPAIYFTRPVRFLVGEEPTRLVESGLYRISRNPMYVSVLLVIFGQSLLYRSRDLLEYGLIVWLGFHIVVIALEEPHLRDERGAPYDEYCRRVPRWIVRMAGW